MSDKPESPGARIAREYGRECWMPAESERTRQALVRLAELIDAALTPSPLAPAPSLAALVERLRAGAAITSLFVLSDAEAARLIESFAGRARKWGAMPDPLEPGWYWVRDHETGPWVMQVVRSVSAETGQDDTLMVVDPLTGSLEELSGYSDLGWSGPIPAPASKETKEGDR